MVTRVSNPVMLLDRICELLPDARRGARARTRRARPVVVVSSPAPASCVIGQPSLTTTIEKSLPRAWRWRISSAQRSTVSGNSGISTTSAPPAMPLVDREPARVASHDLDDHHAVVRLRGGVQAVDRLGRDRDGGVEAERLVGRREVVVDRLRHADHGQAVLDVQPCGDAERVLAADRDQPVELLERGAHRVERRPPR